MQKITPVVYVLFVLVLLHCAFGMAQEGEKTAEASLCPSTEELFETKHQVVINGQPINYRAYAGNLVLKDDNCKPTASLFYISYHKEGVEDASTRPITFCFNGGPGSSSVWLHLGVLGPKRVFLTENGDALPPYHLVDNAFSLLDVTDLVFIDPVSTGYSKAIPANDAKNFHGVEGDIKSVAEFIRLYMTRYNRWESPKFIIGESYGTTRAVGLAGYLHDHAFIYINGLVLISSVLNYQSIDFSNGNDLAYELFLPSYTATAWYHQKLSPDLQANFSNTLQAARDFVINEYTPALFKGNALSAQERQRVIQQLARFTGLSPNYIDSSNLRVSDKRFFKELLRDRKRTVGRFDSRFKGIDADSVGEHFDYDPSAEAIFGAFTATLNSYLLNDLKVKREDRYNILNGTVFPWDWSTVNKYLNVSETLRDVMTKNLYLRVFVGNGYYDMATPFYATEYTFNHLGLDDSLMDHVTMKFYDGGHMMYIYYPSLVKLKQDLAIFYQETLEEQKRREEDPVAIKKP